MILKRVCQVALAVTTNSRDDRRDDTCECAREARRPAVYSTKGVKRKVDSRWTGGVRRRSKKGREEEMSRSNRWRVDEAFDEELF